MRPFRPQLFNFPIPRQLRDRIYEHLLDAELVRGPAYSERTSIELVDEHDDRSPSIAHTYVFQTNVVGVNKVIRQEAGQLLYQRNKFAVVSHKWPQLGELIHKFDIPIVSQNDDAISHFEMDMLHLSIEHPDASEQQQWRSILILLADLDSFCRMIGWLGTQMTWPADIYVRKPGHIGMTTLTVPECHVVRTQIHFRSNPFFTFQPEHFAYPEIPTEGSMCEIMHALSQMMIPAQKLSTACVPKEALSGLVKKTFDNGLREVMSGREVWLSRLTTVVIDSIYDLRGTPDRLVSEGKFEAAISRYCLILEGFARMPVFMDTDLQQIACPSVTGLLRGLVQLILDVAATAGFLLWRQYEVESARYKAVVNDIVRPLFEKLCALPDCGEIHLCGSEHWFSSHEASRLLALDGLLERSAEALENAGSSMKTMQRRAYGCHPSSASLEWDLSILELLKSDQGIREAYFTERMTNLALVGFLSPPNMTPQFFGSTLPWTVTKLMPTRFCGYVDLDRGQPAPLYQ